MAGPYRPKAGTWSQLGGEVAGNPVILQDSTTLVDRAGPGKFVANSGNANLVGTVPKGQTVTVIGYRPRVGRHDGCQQRGHRARSARAKTTGAVSGNRQRDYP